MTLNNKNEQSNTSPTTADAVSLLPPAASYFPMSRGLYEVKPGLHYLGEDFGNKSADKFLFQLDQEYEHYRQNKLRARSERLGKYYQVSDFSSTMQNTLAHFLIKRLLEDYPQLFQLESGSANSQILNCKLSGERLVFAADGQLRDTIPSRNPVDPPYHCALDALASQIQEDLALISLNDDNKNWLSALHLCSPNHWGAEDKIGHDFVTIHQPVAGIDDINRNASKIVDVMINKGPYVRFAWGLATDRYLNHHPAAAAGHDPALWQGRYFDPDAPQLYLRIERQVAWGLPSINSALFTIRTYFTDAHDIKKDRPKNRRLQTALESMSNASLTYKGLKGQEQAILKWLRS